MSILINHACVAHGRETKSAAEVQLTTGEGNIKVGAASSQGVVTDREVPVLDAEDLLLNAGGFGSIQTGIIRFNDGTMATCQGNITLQWVQGKRGFRIHSVQGNIGAKCDLPEGNGKVDKSQATSL